MARDLDELLAWCDRNLKSYDVRVAVLPASGVVRVWIQADQAGKRRVSLKDAQGNKLVGEASLQTPVGDSLEQAAGELLDQVNAAQVQSADVDQARLFQ